MPKKITREQIKLLSINFRYYTLSLGDGMWHKVNGKPAAHASGGTTKFPSLHLVKMNSSTLVIGSRALATATSKKDVSELIRLSIDFIAFVIHVVMLAADIRECDLFCHCSSEDLLFRGSKRKYSEMMSSLSSHCILSLCSVHSHAPDFFCLFLPWSRFAMRC